MLILNGGINWKILHAQKLSSTYWWSVRLNEMPFSFCRPKRKTLLFDFGHTKRCRFLHKALQLPTPTMGSNFSDNRLPKIMTHSIFIYIWKSPIQTPVVALRAFSSEKFSPRIDEIKSSWFNSIIYIEIKFLLYIYIPIWMWIEFFYYSSFHPTQYGVYEFILFCRKYVEFYFENRLISIIEIHNFV